jgi:hypothetical protein
MARRVELSEDQFRTLDRLRPESERLGLYLAGGTAIASLEDLATMKLSATARRGIRRDFWDLYEIFRCGSVTLPGALTSYSHRFGARESDLYHVIRSLTFFEDAEADVLMPDGLTEENWTEIRNWFLNEAPKALASALE